MAELNLKYYGGENLYSDGDVENEILEIAKAGHSLEELESVSFPVLYHMANIRENILNWYPFKEDGHILEIGSGCGAITGLLCRRAEKVVSVELSKRRADINYARHAGMENLEIMVGNLNDMDFGEKFDYVVLNGVFEYAMSFTEGDTPYETFLNSVAGFLKPSGRLLIAIENRLGLKYFSGAPEDHTNAYFDGLNQYEGNDSVRTFSKSEWISLMESCGMKDYKFYYPYPDYKFPKEIFTDKTLSDERYGKRTWNFTEYRITLFDEEKIADTFLREGIMDRFVNSFLIEMAREKMADEEEILYVKLNQDRARRFAIATSIRQKNGEKYVVKSPLDEQAELHLKNMRENISVSFGGNIRNLPGEWKDHSISYPFLKEENLGKRAGKLIQEKKIKELMEDVRMVFDTCLSKGEMTDAYHTEEFSEVFGNTRLEGELLCVKPANIDLILDNIFPVGEMMELIDCEWIFPFAVPSGFILWRSINQLYVDYPHLEEQISRKDFLKEYQITEEMSGVFYSWATHFAEVYVEANKILPYTKPEMWFNLADVRTAWNESSLIRGGVYVDTGAGFSEEQRIPVVSRLDHGRFEIRVPLEGYSGITALRWDPVEGYPCICRIDEEEKRRLKIYPANGKSEDRGDVFATADPIYLIPVEDGDSPRELVIKGEFQRMAVKEALCLTTEEIRRLSEELRISREQKGLKFWRK